MLAKLSLTVHAPLGKSAVPLIRRIIPRAAGILRSPLKELSIILVSDRAMSRLHQDFLGDAATTDVMTFTLEADARGRPVSGEVYACVPEARRQAKVHGSTADRELLLYALHGLLHLNGFDDRTEPDYRRMHRREDQILTKLGIGPLFSPAAAARNKKFPPA